MLYRVGVVLCNNVAFVEYTFVDKTIQTKCCASI